MLSTPDAKFPARRASATSPKPPSPGDFLIVTRNTASLSRYAGQLQALGVPHQVTGGTALNELEELPLLCACLRALVRPDDPVALIAVLRSELFGISDAALYQFKRAGGRFSFREPITADGLAQEHDKPIRDSLDRLHRYFQWLDVFPAVASIERIADDLGLLARACTCAGRRRAGREPGQALRAVPRRRSASSSRWSTWSIISNACVTADEKYDGISVRPHGAPVVRLMNLHKVKGLEAPVVVLADPTGNYEHPIDLHIDRSGDRVRGYMAVHAPRPEIGYSTPRLIACPPEWPRFEETEREFLEAENATSPVRCRDPGRHVSRREHSRKAGKRKSVAHPRGGSFGSRHSRRPRPANGPARRRLSALALADVEAGVKVIDERWRTVRQPTYKIEALKAAALRSDRKEGDVHRPTDSSGDSKFEIGADGAAAAAGRGVEWGEDIHVLLETAMRRPSADLSTLARSLTREREGDFDVEDRVTDLVTTVQKVIRSEIWKRAQASQRALAEVPLTMMAAGDESSTRLPALQRGAIDLVFLETGGWVIVDYKTDRVDARSIKDKIEYYRPQVESYARAWARLVGQPVKEFGLFFTQLNRYEPLS